MPTYQYLCTDCGRDLEVVQKFSDASLTVCPECQGVLRKIFNAVGVVFKGSGFYRTDSRSAPETDSGSSSSSSKKDGDTKSDTKADTKKDAAKGDTKKDTAKSESTSAGSSTPTKAAANASSTS